MAEYTYKPDLKIRAHKIVRSRVLEFKDPLPEDTNVAPKECPAKTWEVTLSNGSIVNLPEEMTARMSPNPGDYYVIAADGYVYLNPKKVFEDKYDLVEGTEDEMPPTTVEGGMGAGRIHNLA